MPPFLAPSTSGVYVGQKRNSDGIASEYPHSKRHATDNVATGAPHAGAAHGSGERYWNVQWRVPQARKHKTWEGDGVLLVNGTTGSLFDSDGKLLTKGSTKSEPLTDGSEFPFGNKDILIDCPLSRAEFLSGRCFGRNTAVFSATEEMQKPRTSEKKFVPFKPVTVNTPKANAPIHPSSDLESDIIDLTQSSKASSSEDKALESYWSVNWRKHQQKKHKTWDGDAWLVHRGDKLTLISESGKILGSKSWEGGKPSRGYQTHIGGREIQIDNEVKRSSIPSITGTSPESQNDDVEFVDPSTTPRKASFLAKAQADQPTRSPIRNSPSSVQKYVPPKSFYGTLPPKPKPKGPLHDPDAEGAVVMKAPTEEHMTKYNKKNSPVVPVVIDPVLARRLRPHQVEGVKFMYESVMGLRKHEGNGCILADEMGMGKTLQTISLVWTLLKQNPYIDRGPIVGKVLIVCPVTLINNWKNEFHKWLGRDRVGIFVGDKDKSAIKQFINSKIHHVLIVGYERLRSIISELAYCQPPIGLIIADEGHRLKSADNKTSKMFEALRTPRRVILSGTPVQNSLREYFAMADFCNPGLLDDYNTFRRVYETPILRSRTPGCTKKEQELGEARSAQLQAISRSFVLRREAGILKNYLPPKHEYIVFVTPTLLQLSIFSKILNPDKLDNIIQSSTAESLALINMLTKISNSPILLKAVADKAKAKSKGEGNIAKTTAVEEAVKLLPNGAQVHDVSLSGKLAALATLLRAIRKRTDEKCIVVSHYTSTLNILEEFCKKKSYTFLRLDGQTPAGKRQELVNTFNKSSQERCFMFLLSSKAGGVGLNLIGASRLCLIDSDWNPSHDLQSMARIHRDGQRREVFIYRFMTAGTIDEKIFQRQTTKLGLSTLIGNTKSESKSDSFTPKELRDIFTIHPHTSCHTHELLDCPCDQSDNIDPFERSMSDGGGEVSAVPKGFVNASQVKPEEVPLIDKAYKKKKKAELAALGEWTHINCLRPDAMTKIQDELLRTLIFSPKPLPGSASTSNPPTGGTTSRIDSLLAAVDIDNVAQLDLAALTVDDVPGGTLSFLFEKNSKVDEEDEDTVPDSSTGEEGEDEDDDEAAMNSVDEEEEEEEDVE